MASYDTPAASRSRPAASRREIGWLLALLLAAAVARAPGILSRAAWYDEMISLVQTSGHAAPAWPRQPAPAGEARRFFAGTASPVEVYRVLRDSDVHPPLYFAALSLWRRALGPSIEVARVLSFVCSLGSVLVLYFLLRSARVEEARPAALVYALATGAAHGGHEARPYALAELALLSAALAAYLARGATPAAPRRALGWALVMAAALGAACHTLYVAGLTAGAVLAWFVVQLWRRARPAAVAGVAVTAAFAALAVPLLLAQRERPPRQLAGRSDLGSELVTLVELNAENLGVSMGGSAKSVTGGWGGGLGLAGNLGFLALTAVGGLCAWRRQRTGEPLWTLLAVLAVAPTLGVFAADVSLGQRLHQPRYVVFATAGLATLTATGLLGWSGRRRRWGVLLLAAVLAIQASRVNWGFERCVRDQSGGIKRSMASVIDGYESPGRLVLIGAGWGVGDPASWLYELAPETRVAVFDDETDLATLLRAAAPYPDLWVAFSTDKRTLGAEQQLLRRLRAGEAYLEVFSNPLAAHFLRVAGRPAAG